MRQIYLSSLVLFMAGLVLITSCSEFSNSDNVDLGKITEQEPYVLLIKHREDDYSTEVSNQISRSLEYAKLPFRTLDLGLISEKIEIPSRTRSIIITTYLANELTNSELERLLAFVTEGNSIVFTTPVTYDNMVYFQGIDPDSDYAVDSTAQGVYFDENILPGFQGKQFFTKQGSFHNGYKRNVFHEDLKVLASSANEKEMPFILSNEIGLGEVITFNSNAMGDKLYRSLIFSTILRGLPGLPYSVANVSTIFLDDFPAPLYNKMLPPIDKEYNDTHAQFVAKTWWPDMKAFADTFNIDYSAMTAFNYNANVVPPFDFFEWQSGSIEEDGETFKGSIYIAHDILDSRHELAFHGYNHFSLQNEDWQNINFMISALQAARKRWRIDNMGSLPTNYVPPTNMIDSTGVQAVAKGMPSIKYMSSLYLGEVEAGGGREFGPEPYAPGKIFDYPRITSGFTMNENSLFDQLSLQLLTGIWTHFIHPDDVFQVEQREEDHFTSRNPLKLGWKSDPDYGYGLYHLLRKRILYTNEQYPLSKYITATEGSKYAQDWTNRISLYLTDGNFFTLQSITRPNYIPKSVHTENHWFMYVKKSQVSEAEPFLETQKLNYVRTEIWDGYLYQFHTERNSLTFPVLDNVLFYDEQFVEQLVQNEIANYRAYLLPPTYAGEVEEWRDTRLEDALETLRKKPNSLQAQNEVIALSIEFSQVDRAISIVEERIKNSTQIKEADIDSLIMYYGWEGAQAQAEIFLEELWDKYENKKVLDVKNQAVEELGLYGDDFDKRWMKRRLDLNPGDRDLLFSYTQRIESEESWPKVKQNLLQLIKENPHSDSLYAYTIQRSIYYESPDSTLALLERFPRSAYPQLQEFASNFSLLYAYDLGNLNRALYWAGKASDFDDTIILGWLGELKLYAQYLELADQILEENPNDSKLRSRIGSQLFYQGFQEKSYTILYPIFQANKEAGTQADTLITEEIGFMDYERKKEFYRRYPAFFNQTQYSALKESHRWKEGISITMDAEYRYDNFNNSYGRGGIGVQFGNRRNWAHTIMARDLYFSDRTSLSDEYFNYAGTGYKFEYKTKAQDFTFSGGPSFLIGNDDFLPEVLLSASYSYDSTFTSVEAKFENVLTSRAIQEDINRFQLQIYREDNWANGHLVTSFSGMGRYHTNEVYEYEAFGRIYIRPGSGKFRFRTLAELSYADATKSFPSGIPYYTPDSYFSKGAGIDLRYRNPDTFEYDSQVFVELLGKHENEEGYYFTGRVQLEHSLNNFWKINIGTDISTSSLYRSNKFFITIKHHFPVKL